MWEPGQTSRRAVTWERTVLKDNGWSYHGDENNPCWHHPGFDIGNEPFTTDGALAAAKCPHINIVKSNDLRYCAYCGIEIDVKFIPPTWNDV